MITVATNVYGMTGVVLTHRVTRIADIPQSNLDSQRSTPVAGEDFVEFRPFDGGVATVQQSKLTDVVEISKEEAIARFTGIDTHREYFVAALASIA